MRITEFGVRNFRSIENILIKFPKNKPLILFGPNNAGKTNILTALNIALGESYPTYREMDESDFFFRDKKNHPEISFYCQFDGAYYTSKRGGSSNAVFITYNYNNGETTENLFHDGKFNKFYISNEQRAQCQAIYLDAIRNINNSLSYSSKYSILSKFSTQIHKSLQQEKKDALNDLFEQIKELFNSSEEFKTFFEKFHAAVTDTIKGFVHTLDVDFSGYDPNNYTKSLRIVGKEGPIVRSFEELGTGEQQTLLMAFVKSYMETFNNESFVLIIEEPEAHLHPIAQRWLKKYINKMCESGIQVVISTHSPEFIDPSNLDGLVKVYKKDSITQIKQIESCELYNHCIELGAPSDKITKENILPFYSACLYSEQLKGLFAQTIILVEGDTESLSLPFYFERAGFNLESNGIEIIKSQGKNNLLKYYRFFISFGYRCFCLFDADEGHGRDKKNDDFKSIFDIGTIDSAQNCFSCGQQWGYFGVDYETYMRSTVASYSDMESDAKDFLLSSSKPIIAKYVAEKNDIIPGFIENIINVLR